MRYIGISTTSIPWTRQEPMASKTG